MKKAWSVILTFVLAFTLFVPAYADSKSVDDALAPYQAVINKVNKEIGSTIYIPVKNKQKVYNNIKDISLSNFEQKLKDEYEEFKNSELNKQSLNSENSDTYNKKSNSTVSLDSIRDDVEQTSPISYNSYMYLDSTVFSVTGKSGTFKYEDILDYGSKWADDFTGYHFEVTSSSYSLSSDNKKCSVYLTGTPVDANGLSLAIVLHANHTFSAG